MELINQIKQLLGEELAPFKAKIESLEAKEAERARTPASDNVRSGIGGGAGQTSGGVISDVKDAADGKGIHAARYFKSLWLAKKNGISPFQAAKSMGYERVAKTLEIREKALTQGTLADGGALVPDEFMAELIPLLRNRSVVLAAGPRIVPMGASLSIPKQTGAGTAYWGNEGTAITTSQPTFGSLQLQEKKLTALVPISNDLMRNASIAADMIVRDDVVSVVSIAKDLAYLRGNGSAGAPRGIRNWLASANLFTETITTPGSQTLAEVRKELAKLKKFILKNNRVFVKPVWFMSAQVAAAIESITDGNGNAIFFQGMNSPNPTLLGFPVFITEQIPSVINSGGTADTGGTASELYLVDMDDVLVGESMALEVEVFPNGTYVASGSARSGISYDETVIRAIEKTDLVMRHDISGACVKNCSWL